MRDLIPFKLSVFAIVFVVLVASPGLVLGDAPPGAEGGKRLTMTIGGHTVDLTDQIQAAGDAFWESGASGAAAETQARAALARGDVVGARAALDRGLAQCPGHPGLLVYRARVQAAQRNTAGAQEDLLAAIARSPENPEAHGLLALLRLGHGDAAAARSSAERALALQATQPEALLAQAQMDLAANDGAGALDKLDRAIEANQTFEDGRVLRVSILSRTKGLAATIPDLEALRYSPTHGPSVRQQLIRYYVHGVGKPGEAWRQVREMEEAGHPLAARFRAELTRGLGAEPK